MAMQYSSVPLAAIPAETSRNQFMAYDWFHKISRVKSLPQLPVQNREVHLLDLRHLYCYLDTETIINEAATKWLQPIEQKVSAGQLHRGDRCGKTVMNRWTFFGTFRRQHWINMAGVPLTNGDLSTLISAEYSIIRSSATDFEEWLDYAFSSYRTRINARLTDLGLVAGREVRPKRKAGRLGRKEEQQEEDLGEDNWAHHGEREQVGKSVGDHEGNRRPQNRARTTIMGVTSREEHGDQLPNQAMLEDTIAEAEGKSAGQNLGLTGTALPGIGIRHPESTDYFGQDSLRRSPSSSMEMSRTSSAASVEEIDNQLSLPTICPDIPLTPTDSLSPASLTNLVEKSEDDWSETHWAGSEQFDFDTLFLST